MVELKANTIRIEDIEEVEAARDDHVGDFLREARENVGRSVSDIAAVLRIRRSFVEAIEDGRFDDLPGPAYAAGFIRSYAEYLGLDAPGLVVRFRAESSASENRPELEFPVPVTAGWFPTGAVVAGCVVLAAVVFGGWYYLQHQDAIQIVRVPPAPARQSVGGEPETGAAAQNGKIVPVAELADPPPVASKPPGGAEEGRAAGDAAGDDGESGAADAAVAAATTAAGDEAAPYRSPRALSELVIADPIATADEQRVEPSVADTGARDGGTGSAPTPAAEHVAAAPPAADAAPVAEAAPAAPLRAEPAAAPPVQSASLPRIPVATHGDAERGGRTYGVINRNARVIIAASADSWVQVLDDDQNVLLTRMLRPGDRYLVPDRDDLVMLTGNAGGLEIYVDGEQVPGIGADGAILHNVRLDVELLKAGRAVIR